MVDLRDVRAGQGRLQQFERLVVYASHCRLLPFAFYCDKAGAETVDARVVLVATVLVDLSFAAERRFLRHDRQAVRFNRAVAATFANEVVDHDELVRILELAAFAAATFLGCAGLCVDQYRYARDFAQLSLDAIEIATIGDRGARREFGGGEQLRLVRNDRDTLDAFGVYRVRDALHRQRTIERLATGHRNGIVEEDLVGNVRARRNRLANGERSRMIERAVAQILEDMLVTVEQRPRNPVDAFAAHLDQAVRFAAHPAGHEMAADSGQRLRALGYLRRRIVRAARTEIGDTLCAADLDRMRAALQLLGASAESVTAEHTVEATPDDRHEVHRCQFADPGYEAFAVLVLLADHAVGLAARVVVEVLLELALDDPAFFLDDQHLDFFLHEVERTLWLEWPDHTDFVDVDAESARFRLLDAEQAKGLHQV